MAPFHLPRPVLEGFKEKIESLYVHGDRLYIGTATGNLYIYSVDNSPDEGEDHVSLVDVRKNVARKAIDQIGFLKDINSLVILSEMTLTLYPLPAFTPPRPLPQARACFSFAVHSFITHDHETHIPSMLTYLVAGCRRKVVIYTYKDGELQQTQESPLPHSPRTITFMSDWVVCFAYTTTDFVRFDLRKLAVGDIGFPPPTTATVGSGPTGVAAAAGSAAVGALGGAMSNIGMSGITTGISGLTGYMTLGIGSKTAKPNVVRVAEKETLILKDAQATFITPDGNPSTDHSTPVEYPVPPEELSFVRPYLLSILPAGVPVASAAEGSEVQVQVTTTPQIQIRSILSAQPSSSPSEEKGNSKSTKGNDNTPAASPPTSIQTIPFPFIPPTSSTTPTPHTLRFLTPSSSKPSSSYTLTSPTSPTSQSPLGSPPNAKDLSFFLLSTPTDRTSQQTVGSTLWYVAMKPWNVQVDELVKEGAYEEALGLVGEIGIGEDDVDVNIHVQSTPPPSAVAQESHEGAPPKDISVSAPKVSLRKHLQTLSALSQFKAGNFDAAIDKFIELDINPAKVLALYPSSVSGRLSVPREKWVGLFGGPETETTQEAESPAPAPAPAQTTQDATSGVETPVVPASPTLPKNQGVNTKESKFVPPDFLDTLTSSTSAPGSAVPSPSTATLRGRFRGLGSLIGAGAVAKEDDDTASVRSFNPFQGRNAQGGGEKEKEKEKGKEKHGDELPRSVETLVRYLSDRRPQLGKLLDQHHITPSSSTFVPSPPLASSTSTDADADAAEAHSKPGAEPQPITPLSAASPQSLFTLPSVPLTQLSSLQLIRFAQMVDTALFKSYLLIRPSMLGPLCRLPNWCEVVQVEKELREHGKFNELRDLYGGKKMHDKALELLREQAAKKLSQYVVQEKEEDKEDREDRLRPSVAYLQKLGPEYLSTIFAASKWLFEEDKDLAFDIFTSEDVDLPRKEVVDYLEGVDASSSSSSHHGAGAGVGTGSLAVRFLEWLISERKEESTAFHDRLAELYLKGTVGAKRRGDTATQNAMYEKLLTFIKTTDHYRVDRLYGLISSDVADLYEARAILLGRLSRHDQALELYVYKLQDFIKAEEYCKQYYHPHSPTQNIFLTLLRIYLQPTSASKSTTSSTGTGTLLRPALDLISRHSPRLDTIETLQLLPPLVTTQDLKAYLFDALRAPVFDTRVERNIAKSRNEQVSRKLMVLQSQRVKITDSRICAQCSKRIGPSAIAVHAPRGEVTHYKCREAFSQKLKEMRR